MRSVCLLRGNWGAAGLPLFDNSAPACWLIFKLPPSEVAVHPSEQSGLREFFLTTDDLDLEISGLKKAGVPCEAITRQSWGRLTRITLPGGGTLGLYEPRHARPE